MLIKDNTESLPLHTACALNHIAIVRLLLNEKNAKKALLMKNGGGKTARQLCSSNFMASMVEGNISLSISDMYNDN